MVVDQEDKTVVVGVDFLKGADKGLTERSVWGEIGGDDATGGKDVIGGKVAHDDDVFVDGQVFRIDITAFSDNNGVFVEDDLVEVVVGVGGNDVFFNTCNGAGIAKKKFLFEFLANTVLGFVKILLNGVFDSFLETVFSFCVSGGTGSRDIFLSFNCKNVFKRKKGEVKRKNGKKDFFKHGFIQYWRWCKRDCK